MTTKPILSIAVAFVLLATVASRKITVKDNPVEASLNHPVYSDGDLQAAASGHHAHGRVHIKVYRGPSDGHHAAHGFWVKQPADDHRH